MRRKLPVASVPVKVPGSRYCTKKSVTFSQPMFRFNFFDKDRLTEGNVPSDPIVCGSSLPVKQSESRHFAPISRRLLDGSNKFKEAALGRIKMIE